MLRTSIIRGSCAGPPFSAATVGPRSGPRRDQRLGMFLSRATSRSFMTLQRRRGSLPPEPRSPGSGLTVLPVRCPPTRNQNRYLATPGPTSPRAPTVLIPRSFTTTQRAPRRPSRSLLTWTSMRPNHPRCEASSSPARCLLSKRNSGSGIVFVRSCRNGPARVHGSRRTISCLCRSAPFRAMSRLMPGRAGSGSSINKSCGRWRPPPRPQHACTISAPCVGVQR